MKNEIIDFIIFLFERYPFAGIFLFGFILAVMFYFIVLILEHFFPNNQN